MIASLKSFTRQVTQLLCFSIWLVWVPFPLAQLLGLTGVLGWVNGWYTGNRLIFWVLYLMVVGVYGAACFFICVWLVDRGSNAGWFWFKPKRNRYQEQEDEVDKSGLLIAGIAAVILFLLSYGFGLWFESGIQPPFIPAPKQ